MFTPAPENLVRVTVTLPAVDVDLLDRLARLEGLNRSAELRNVLAQFRPLFQASVAAFEAATAQRERLDTAMADASLAQLQAVVPEVERIQHAFLGALSRLEGAAAAHDAGGDDAPASNTGATNP